MFLVHEFRFSCKIFGIGQRDEFVAPCRLAEGYGYDTVFATDHLGTVSESPTRWRTKSSSASCRWAADLGRPALVPLFADGGPRAIAALHGQAADALVPWPGADAMTTWAEAVRIGLMESVVHLLDVLDALGEPPDLPAAGLRETSHLLADLADPVEFIEAATGRSATTPLPVLR